MTVHRRQFIIGPAPILPEKNWTYIELEQSIYLSYCSKLPVASARDADEVPWYLLGIAAQTDSERPNPVQEISISHTYEVEKLYSNWSGRWVLFGSGRIHMDATGLLTCYYRKTELSCGTRYTWVSSSAILLTNLPNSLPLPKERLNTRAIGMDWVPPPVTRFPSIYRLLPSQILDIRTCSLMPRKLVPEIAAFDYNQLLDELEKRLVTGMIQASKDAGTVWMPLTAGYDSRLFLACAIRAGIDVKTFTQEYSGMAKGDRMLPPFLAKRAGLEYRWIAKGEFSSQAEELYDNHTGCQIKESDREFFSHGQWDWLKDGDLVFRENALTLGRCFMWRRFTKGLPQGMLPPVREIAGGYYEEADSPLIGGVKMWLQWVKEAPEDIDWRDRFHIELRIAGWQGLIEQSLDLINCERFFAANASNILALLLKIPTEKRQMSLHHIDLIKRMAPELAGVPFNPPDPFYLRTLKVFKQIGKADSLGALGKRLRKKIKL